MICTIKKGSNYCSGWSLGTMHSGITSQKFSVMFSDSCKIRPTSSNCANDWNKLFGFSYGMHHTNSLRLAWRALPSGIIKIASYIYENGKMRYDAFATTPVLTMQEMGITYDTDNNTVYFHCGEQIIVQSFNKAPSWGYYLKPYYGGDCPAPETVQITLL